MLAEKIGGCGRVSIHSFPFLFSPCRISFLGAVTESAVVLLLDVGLSVACSACSFLAGKHLQNNLIPRVLSDMSPQTGSVFTAPHFATGGRYDCSLFQTRTIMRAVLGFSWAFLYRSCLRD